MTIRGVALRCPHAHACTHHRLTLAPVHTHAHVHTQARTRTHAPPTPGCTILVVVGKAGRRLQSGWAGPESVPEATRSAGHKSHSRRLCECANLTDFPQRKTQPGEKASLVHSRPSRQGPTPSGPALGHPTPWSRSCPCAAGSAVAPSVEPADTYPAWPRGSAGDGKDAR